MTFDHVPSAEQLLDDLAETVARRVAELLQPIPRAASPWLTVDEAAEHRRCKPKRIYDLVSQSRLPAHRDGSRVLFRRDELDEYLFNAASTNHR